MFNFGREDLCLHDPGSNDRHRRRLAHDLLLGVEFIHLCDEIFSVAVFEFLNRIDASTFKQLGVLARNAFDTKQIRHVHAFQPVKTIISVMVG